MDKIKRIQLTANLYADEYIPRELYLKYLHKPHLLIGMLDKRLVKADQLLRDKFGLVTINNWIHGGDRQWSGIRTPESPDYSFLSQHSWGRASDKIFRDATSEEVRDYIAKNWQTLGITCIEANVDWVHSDVRWWTGNELLIVYP